MKLLLSLTLMPMLAFAAGLGGEQNFNSQNLSPFTNEEIFLRRGTFQYPAQEVLNFAGLNVLLVKDANSEIQELQKVKYYILNGETRLARLYLEKMNYSQTKLRPVIYRYQGILSFLEGDFKKSFSYLSRPELQVSTFFPRICVLKVLDRIVLSKTHKLELEWERCKSENRRHLTETSLPWMDMLIELKMRPVEGVTATPFKDLRLALLTVPELKLFLKLALYLNQEKRVIPQFTTLEFEQIRDTEVRELMGHLYFRDGQLVNAYRLIDGISSPNTENIRGNLYLLRQKFELAYAQFKLALEMKQNSQNALERLLPLAWVMKDWGRGSEFAERVVASPQTQISKLTIIAAFHLQNERYDDAKKIMNVITERSRNGYHLDAAQIHTYVGLIQNSPDVVKKNARSSCDQFDLMYCWLSYQMNQWEAFPLTMKRKDVVMEKSEWEKLTTEDINEPLKETVYIHQLDIEEMDNALISLVKSETEK
jgi:hypothetical protein